MYSSLSSANCTDITPLQGNTESCIYSHAHALLQNVTTRKTVVIRRTENEIRNIALQEQKLLNLILKRNNIINELQTILKNEIAQGIFSRLCIVGDGLIKYNSDISNTESISLERESYAKNIAILLIYIRRILKNNTDNIKDQDLICRELYQNFRKKIPNLQVEAIIHRRLDEQVGDLALELKDAIQSDISNNIYSIISNNNKTYNLNQLNCPLNINNEITQCLIYICNYMSEQGILYTGKINSDNWFWDRYFVYPTHDALMLEFAHNDFASLKLFDRSIAIDEISLELETPVKGTISIQTANDKDSIYWLSSLLKCPPYRANQLINKTLRKKLNLFDHPCEPFGTYSDIKQALILWIEEGGFGDISEGSDISGFVFGIDLNKINILVDDTIFFSDASQNVISKGLKEGVFGVDINYNLILGSKVKNFSIKRCDADLIEYEYMHGDSHTFSHHHHNYLNPYKSPNHFHNDYISNKHPPPHYHIHHNSYNSYKPYNPNSKQRYLNHIHPRPGYRCLSHNNDIFYDNFYLKNITHKDSLTQGKDSFDKLYKLLNFYDISNLNNSNIKSILDVLTDGEYVFANYLAYAHRNNINTVDTLIKTRQNRCGAFIYFDQEGKINFSKIRTEKLTGLNGFHDSIKNIITEYGTPVTHTEFLKHFGINGYRIWNSSEKSAVDILAIFLVNWADNLSNDPLIKERWSEYVQNIEDNVYTEYWNKNTRDGIIDLMEKIYDMGDILEESLEINKIKTLISGI